MKIDAFSFDEARLGLDDVGSDPTGYAHDLALWPVSYALQKWSPVVEKKVVEPMKAAIS